MSRGLFRVLRDAAENRRPDAPVCAHLDQVRVSEAPHDTSGCEECLSTGGRWLHLRMCLTCGHVGCCDSSPNRHASAHAELSHHPLVRSLEPGEDWSWCYADQVAFVLRSRPLE